MCSIFFAYDAHPKYRLILAANRDEFYERPTAAAHFWLEDAPEILAGRDSVYGGTWLGVTRSGRFSAVTNYRDPLAPTGNSSRGNLVGDFLRSAETPARYLQKVRQKARDYSGFNLLVGAFGSAAEIGYFSNRSEQGDIKILESGIYGLSNHLLDTPWRKVTRGKAALANLIEKENLAVESLFEILLDASRAADEDLPETGIGLERERLLSPIFIETPVYGTRSSTVLLIETSGRVSFSERTYRQSRNVWKEENFTFEIENRVDVALGNGLSCLV
ncbi:MAG: NRDE family protein [Acidobacteriota bacterium]|nr:NRDE family protein [Acidobacteriota bacterium]